MTQFLDPRLPDRFWSRALPCPMSGCWIWTGSAGDNGYGYLYDLGPHAMRKRQLTHRMAFRALVGEIQSGLELDHLCRTTLCCNPAHLEAVTRRENFIRGIGPAVNRARNLARTSCRRGHPYQVPPLVDRRGTRVCGTCKDINERRL